MSQVKFVTVFHSPYPGNPMPTNHILYIGCVLRNCNVVKCFGMGHLCPPF